MNYYRNAGDKTKLKRRDFRYYLAAAISLITLAVYLFSLRNDFVEWDDFLYVVDNPHIRSFDTAFFRWAFFDFHAANWHPLTWMSHAMDYAVWELDPAGHHLTNVILHSVNTFLVVLLFVRLLASRQAGKLTSQHDSRFVLIAAATTGLLFGLHPLHVESAAWVSERKDLLCALFYLLSIMSYMTYVTGTLQGAGDKGHTTQSADGMENRAKIYSAFRQRPLLLAFCFFILALLSKPMAVSLPLVLLILDWYPFGRVGSISVFRRLLAEKLPFLACSLVSSVLTVFAQKAGAAIVNFEAIPLARRVMVAAGSLSGYLWKMIYPLDLNPFYPYPKAVPLTSPESYLPSVIAIGVTLFSIALAKRWRLWPAVWGYYVITLFPVLGIVQVGSQSMADRYTYLPSLGPFLIAGIAAAWAFGKVRRSLAGRVCCYLAAFLMFSSMTYLTVKQIGVWKNSFTLWDYVLQREPGVSIAYNNRAVAYYRLGDFDRAVTDLDRAIGLDPHYASAFYNMACIYSLRNDAEGACAWLRRSIENGYGNRAKIMQDRDFDNIRNTSCYKSIMEGG